jgi:sigma-B regulation protein RsbU (phosphoserine phosphatase)
MNALVHANTAIDRFITFFWGILDTEAHTFHYVNAGHNPPYLVHKDRTLRPLGEGGLILGVLAAPPPYEDETVGIAPGETIVAYTDGVNEAMSAQMREFGDERLQMLLANLAGASAEEIVGRVRSDILDFTCGAPQSDDITMLVVRRL